MYEDGILTIQGWNKGMASYPTAGFGLLQNVDVFENVGIAKIKNRSFLRTGITPTQLPIAEVYDVYGNTYTLTGYTGSGVCYKNGTAIQSSLGTLCDMVIYKDYLWVRHSTVLSCYGPLNNSPQWFGNVDTGYGSTYNAKLLRGQDDFLYSTNGNHIAKIDVTSSGTAGVAPTLSVNKTALKLPDGQYATTMAEFGTKIVIGTQGGDSYFGIGAYNTARLYSWNRQLGTLGNPGLADLPVTFNENGINAIIQFANKLYISAGSQGNIYLSDATNYIKIASLPFTVSGLNYSSFVHANALAISQHGTLLVGLSGDIDSNTKLGIYEIDINTEGYPLVLRKTSSNTTGTLKIGFINPTSYQVTNTGWSNNATYGVDTTLNTLYNNYGGVIESPLYRVGTYNNKETFSHIEWSLSEPLVSGQGIKISYRRNIKESYTEIGEWTFSTLGSVTSFSDTAGIADCEFIQLKIELDQNLATSAGSNMNLISVTLS